MSNQNVAIYSGWVRDEDGLCTYVGPIPHWDLDELRGYIDPATWTICGGSIIFF